MNKYSYIALALAVLIGLLGGGLFKSCSKDKELSELKEEHRKAIEVQIKNSEQVIKKLDSALTHKNDSLAIVKSKIVKLQKAVNYEKNKNKQLRDEASKFSVSSKQEWIITRYDSLSPKSDSVVTLNDTTASRVIDDLIVKDGLEIKTKLQDSVISEYKASEKLYDSVLTLHVSKEKELSTIISNKDQINDDLVKSNKELKKEVRKEKIKVAALKILAIGEAVGLIALLIL